MCLFTFDTLPQANDTNMDTQADHAKKDRKSFLSHCFNSTLVVLEIIYVYTLFPFLGIVSFLAWSEFDSSSHIFLSTAFSTILPFVWLIFSHDHTLSRI